ncbi:MAG: outer membrane lipoprotein chaperone LolA [Rhodocyclaceae bacterium]|nr:outer membrane lipoprotein chaperone LolA [Rhodocyclaceae bacterium]MCB1964069.1 outer membrane lipoprotein chaperone LolA [Rhodocyclaceae bacterium]
MERSRRCFVALLCFALTAPGALAATPDGVTQLKRFVAATERAEGRFVQSVYRQNGGRADESEGNFAFERPGKFRWNYVKPYPQVLVGDGARLWSYDPELGQVTVKKMGDALGSTPAAILAGDGALDATFTLEDGGEANGLVWAIATPKAADSSFARMKLGFRDGALVGMEIRDNFGHTTILRFTRLTANVAIDPATFRFTPPAGVDVIGE